MERCMKWMFVVVGLLLLEGCTWLAYQETKLHSGSRYLQVDAETQNFGYQRLMINCQYREQVNTFIQNHGYPEFIFEYNQREMEGIRLFYLKQDRVYDFLERGMSGYSATLIDQRPRTSWERAELEEKLNREPL